MAARKTTASNVQHTVMTAVNQITINTVTDIQDPIVNLDDFPFDDLAKVIKSNTKPNKEEINNIIFNYYEIHYYKNTDDDVLFEILKHHILPDKRTVSRIVTKYISLHYGVEDKCISYEEIDHIIELLEQVGLKIKNKNNDIFTDTDDMMAKLIEYHAQS